MIRSCEANFPCREAARCFLTDKERGLRIAVNQKNGRLELVYSKHRTIDEEWYVSMEDVAISPKALNSIPARVSSPSIISTPDLQKSPTFVAAAAAAAATTPRKRMCFRSVRHGVFLACSSDGKVFTSDKKGPGTQWLMATSLSFQARSPVEASTMSPRQQSQRGRKGSQYHQQYFFSQEPHQEDMPPSGRDTPPLPLRVRTRTNSSGSANMNVNISSLQRSNSQLLDSPESIGTLHEQGHSGLFLLCAETNRDLPLRYTAQDQFTTNLYCNEDNFKDEDDTRGDIRHEASTVDGRNYDNAEDDTTIWWEMEFTSGELCFLSNPTIDQRLRCDFLGKMSLSEQWKGWEVFRFIEASSMSIQALGDESRADQGNNRNGELIISSWTHHKKVLASDPDGNVFTTENRLGHWERWRVLKAPDGGGVWIQSVAHGRILCVQSEQPTQRFGQEFQDASKAIRRQVDDVGDKLLLFKDNLAQNISNKVKAGLSHTEDTSRVGGDASSAVLNNLHLFKTGLLQSMSNSRDDTLEQQQHPAIQIQEQRKKKHDSCLRQSYRLHTTTKTNDPKCNWHIEAAHSHVYYLTLPCHNQQLASDKSGPFVTRNRKEWEQWKIERSSGEAASDLFGRSGCFTLKSVAHSKYLGATSAGSVHTTSQAGEWSLWEIIESPHYDGAVYIVSHSHQRQLAVDDKGRISTSYQGNQEWQSWRLEPCLPSSVSGTHMAAMAAAGVVGLALTVATPFAVLGAVEAVGLTATELAVGFTAEAIAGFSGGALLGAGVVGSTAMSLSKQQQPDYYERNNDDGGTILNSSSNQDTGNDGHCQLVSSTTDVNEDFASNSLRPLSAWRNW